MDDKSMQNQAENKNGMYAPNLSDHLANERTFLAWVRTSIGIMAFGFVVEKFSIFIKQITLFLGKTHLSDSVNNAVSHQGYSSFFGVLLVAFGILICIFAFIKYKKIEKQITAHTYKPSTLLEIALALFVTLMGICLVVYLINS